METQHVQRLTATFEGPPEQTEIGVEYWLARDLQHLLGYSKWENFQTVVAKAKTYCEVSGHSIENHFPDVRKMVQIGSGTELVHRGIRPESLAPADDVKKAERRRNADKKHALTNPAPLDGEGRTGRR